MEGDKDLEIGIGGGSIINLDPASPSPVPELTGKIHQVPCCIKYDGPSPVSQYFKPKLTEIEVDGLKVEEAYFRGRKLQGTTLPLPHGYSGFGTSKGEYADKLDVPIKKKGFIIGKKSSGKRKVSDRSGGDSNSWQMKANFQNITLWNHDNIPSQDDAFLRSFHWFSVAKSLHQPVSAEDLEVAFIPH